MDNKDSTGYIGAGEKEGFICFYVIEVWGFYKILQEKQTVTEKPEPISEYTAICLHFFFARTLNVLTPVFDCSETPSTPIATVRWHFKLQIRVETCR